MSPRRISTSPSAERDLGLLVVVERLRVDSDLLGASAVPGRAQRPAPRPARRGAPTTDPGWAARARAPLHGCAAPCVRACPTGRPTPRRVELADQEQRSATRTTPSAAGSRRDAPPGTHRVGLGDGRTASGHERRRHRRRRRSRAAAAPATTALRQCGASRRPPSPPNPCRP